jgi:hypothetical protein
LGAELWRFRKQLDGRSELESGTLSVLENLGAVNGGVGNENGSDWVEA